MAKVGANVSLVVRAATRLCALNMARVVEIMRPLPVNQMASTAGLGIVRGLSVIRGEPVPVVALAAIFGEPQAPCTRFVLVRTGRSLVALAVDEVVGAWDLDELRPGPLPPLLRDANVPAIEAVAALDSELYFVLNTSHMVPEEVWESLEHRVEA